VQYERGKTVHSPFKFGIDEATTGDFHLNIGQKTFQPRHIRSADLIVRDEVSTLTRSGQRCGLFLMTVTLISGETDSVRGELLQLLPVVQGVSMPVPHRLITRLSWWNSIREFRPDTPLRTSRPEWVAFLLSVALDRTNPSPSWTDLATHFGASVSADSELAQTVFRAGVEADQPFPVDPQRICPANKLTSQVNHRIQQWRSGRARNLEAISAIRELRTR
jgi:hypothetical protein